MTPENFEFMTPENIHYNRYLQALAQSPFLKDSSIDSLEYLLSQMMEERWSAKNFLAIETIVTDASQSFVRHDPIGTVLAIMPWNFTFWQVLRYASPTLIAGNTGLLKHAPSVFGSAKLIEELFIKAGIPEGVFQNLIVHHDQTEKIIEHNTVQAVTLTGSEGAGSAVAEIAGKYIKKTVLELGGNNAFIV